MPRQLIRTHGPATLSTTTCSGRPLRRALSGASPVLLIVLQGFEALDHDRPEAPLVPQPLAARCRRQGHGGFPRTCRGARPSRDRSCACRRRRRTWPGPSPCARCRDGSCAGPAPRRLRRPCEGGASQIDRVVAGARPGNASHRSAISCFGEASRRSGVNSSSATGRRAGQRQHADRHGILGVRRQQAAVGPLVQRRGRSRPS